MVKFYMLGYNVEIIMSHALIMKY